MKRIPSFAKIGTVGISNKCLLETLIAAFSSLVSMEQSPAQLFIDVYQSQGNTYQTLWIFSGSSSTRTNSSGGIRTSASSNI